MARLKVVFDQIGQDKRPYDREREQRILVAVSDSSIQAPWHEIPLDAFQIIVPEHDMLLDEMADFVRRRLSALEEDGCVMVRYETKVDASVSCKFGLVFAPGREQMGFVGDEDKAVEGTLDELVDLVVSSAVVSDVMDL